MNEKVLKIGIIDDDTIFVNEFITFFEGNFENTCVFKAYNLSEVLDNIQEIPSDVELMFLDIMMPGVLGIDGLVKLKKALPNTIVVMLTAVENEEYLFKALCSGAGGYVIKSGDFKELMDYINIIKTGGSALSPKMARYLVGYFGPKERPENSKLTEKNLQVLHLLAEGWAYKTIADRMGISIDGVRYHIKEIYQILGVQSIGQAVKKYVSNDLPNLIEYPQKKL